MQEITGGVCAAKGFKASGIHCGIRKNTSKKDLALIVSEQKATAAAVYTKNLVKGAPLLVTKSHLKNGYAQAVICNSGNANTCNANGKEIAEQMCDLVASEMGIHSTDVLVASTGVIGQPLHIEPIAQSVSQLVSQLCFHNSSAAAEAIMTTDTIKKEYAVRFKVGEIDCSIGGIAKGSGMIHPNMATMLVFITTDVCIDHELLQKALSEDVKTSFNMVSVDGDTSTNDMVTILANGMAGNNKIQEDNKDYAVFCEALHCVTTHLCKMIAGDGEGATKLIECIVNTAQNQTIAQIAAKSVICSSLVKAAMFGEDANWGRILCALGYCGADINVEKIDVVLASAAGEILVCKSGAGVEFSETKAKKILQEKEISIRIQLNSGKASATAWGCDLTYDYVKINGDYRT